MERFNELAPKREAAHRLADIRTGTSEEAQIEKTINTRIMAHSAAEFPVSAALLVQRSGFLQSEVDSRQLTVAQRIDAETALEHVRQSHAVDSMID